jgi:hypothetical protein
MVSSKTFKEGLLVCAVIALNLAFLAEYWLPVALFLGGNFLAFKLARKGGPVHRMYRVFVSPAKGG